jgi:hypothetical protein
MIAMNMMCGSEERRARENESSFLIDELYERVFFIIILKKSKNKCVQASSEEKRD